MMGMARSPWWRYVRHESAQTVRYLYSCPVTQAGCKVPHGWFSNVLRDSEITHAVITVPAVPKQRSAGKINA